MNQKLWFLIIAKCSSFEDTTHIFLILSLHGLGWGGKNNVYLLVGNSEKHKYLRGGVSDFFLFGEELAPSGIYPRNAEKEDCTRGKVGITVSLDISVRGYKYTAKCLATAFKSTYKTSEN